MLGISEFYKPVAVHFTNNNGETNLQTKMISNIPPLKLTTYNLYYIDDKTHIFICN